MTEEQIALGRRAVACKGWRWMPGMATYTPVPYTSPHLGRILSGENDIFHLWRDETIPRLRDPATLGCLLALVREAFDSPGMCACMMHGPREWMILLDRSNHVIGRTEAEALIAALEAAP